MQFNAGISDTKAKKNKQKNTVKVNQQQQPI